MTNRVRNAVRAVVLNDDMEVLIVHNVEKGFYHLPGGGVLSSENVKDAVLREVLEETGYIFVISNELGKYEENLGDILNVTYGFLGNVDGEIGKSLESDEESFQNRWFTIIQASKLMAEERINPKNNEYKSFIDRELHFLDLAEKIINSL